MKWASRAAALAVLTLSGLCRAGPLEDMLAIDWKGYFPNTFTTKRLVPRLGGTAIQLAVASQVPKVVKKALNTEEGKRLGDVTNRRFNRHRDDVPRHDIPGMLSVDFDIVHRRAARR